MKIICYVLARQGSSRIPNKNMMKFNGRETILRTFDQVRKIKYLDNFYLATTDSRKDDEIASLAEKNEIDAFRGHEEYVLDRVYEAARKHRADVILYASGDGPLIDPIIYSNILNFYKQNDYDLVTCYEPQTFPGGYDFNIINFKSLELAYKSALAPSQRINMFSYFTFHPEIIKTYNYSNDVNLSNYHLSLDNPEDIKFFQKFFYLADELKIEINLKNTLQLINENKELKLLSLQIEDPYASHALFNSIHILKGFFQDIDELLTRAIRENDERKRDILIKESILIASKIGK